jgi:hypothetical protein
MLHDSCTYIFTLQLKRKFHSRVTEYVRNAVFFLFAMIGTFYKKRENLRSHFICLIYLMPLSVSQKSDTRISNKLTANAAPSIYENSEYHENLRSKKKKKKKKPASERRLEFGTSEYQKAVSAMTTTLVSFLQSFINLFIHSIVSLTTGPQPHPKRVLHKRDLVLPLSISNILTLPYGHPVAAYFFFLVFPSLFSTRLSFL